MAPNVENLRKQAKTLRKQWKAADADAVARVRKGLPRLADVAADDMADADVTLQEVQHVIAVEQGFGNWKQMLTAAGASPRHPRRTSYLRPGLPNVVRETEWFLGMVHRGEGWSMDRVRRLLPRVADLSDEEIARADVTMEEARQVVAEDYGYVDWEELESELGRLHPIQTFEDFAELEDDEIRQVIFRAGRDRLAVALKSATQKLMDRLQANMDAAAWQALVDAIDALGPVPASTVEVEQARFVQQYRSDDPLI